MNSVELQNNILRVFVLIMKFDIVRKLESFYVIMMENYHGKYR